MKNIMENEENATRVFAELKNIGEIRQTDEKVTIMGIASNVNPSMEFVLTDETGKYNIREIPSEITQINNGTQYRVIGNVNLDGSGSSFIQALAVQDMSDLDMDLYKKALELKEKIE